MPRTAGRRRRPLSHGVKQSPHDADAPVLAPGEWEAANREARLAQDPAGCRQLAGYLRRPRDVGLSESHFDRCRPLA